jgi:tetrahydromethanopterin S-methyltransferase subunit G
MQSKPLDTTCLAFWHHRRQRFGSHESQSIGGILVKIFRFIPAFIMLSLAILVVGCGPSKEQQQLSDQSAKQKALIESVQRENAQLQRAAKAALDRNAEVRNRLQSASDEIFRANNELEDVLKRLAEIEQQIKTTTSEVASTRPARSGSSFWYVLFVIIVILVVIFVIIKLTRSRGDMEEDDDDFADFEDDDLGFEDEDFQDDLGGDDKEKKDEPKA